MKRFSVLKLSGALFCWKREFSMAHISYFLSRLPGQKSFCNSCCPARAVVPLGVTVSSICRRNNVPEIRVLCTVNWALFV